MAVQTPSFLDLNKAKQELPACVAVIEANKLYTRSLLSRSLLKKDINIASIELKDQFGIKNLTVCFSNLQLDFKDKKLKENNDRSVSQVISMRKTDVYDHNDRRSDSKLYFCIVISQIENQKCSLNIEAVEIHSPATNNQPGCSQTIHWIPLERLDDQSTAQLIEKFFWLHRKGMSASEIFDTLDITLSQLKSNFIKQMAFYGRIIAEIVTDKPDSEWRAKYGQWIKYNRNHLFYTANDIEDYKKVVEDNFKSTGMAFESMEKFIDYMQEKDRIGETNNQELTGLLVDIHRKYGDSEIENVYTI